MAAFHQRAVPNDDEDPQYGDILDWDHYGAQASNSVSYNGTRAEGGARNSIYDRRFGQTDQRPRQDYNFLRQQQHFASDVVERVSGDGATMTKPETETENIQDGASDTDSDVLHNEDEFLQYYNSRDFVPRSTPSTFPLDEETQLFYIDLLEAGFMDLSNVEDGPQAQRFIREGYYPRKAIQKACWDVLVSFHSVSFKRFAESGIACKITPRSWSTY